MQSKANTSTRNTKRKPSNPAAKVKRKAKGRESYDDGVPIVVVGVTPHQGERESRLHGRSGTGVLDLQEWSGMRNACDVKPHDVSESVGWMPV